MTDDSSPLPGESATGYHRPERHFPGGLTPQRIAAHWRTEHRSTPLTHTHHASESTP